MIAKLAYQLEHFLRHIDTHLKVKKSSHLITPAVLELYIPPIRLLLPPLLHNNRLLLVVLIHLLIGLHLRTLLRVHFDRLLLYLVVAGGGHVVAEGQLAVEIGLGEVEPQLLLLIPAAFTYLCCHTVACASVPNSRFVHKPAALISPGSAQTAAHADVAIEATIIAAVPLISKILRPTLKIFRRTEPKIALRHPHSTLRT